ncbi:membrane protein insertion efficiency factor YidD [Corynebacterium sp.]|uniref:membrane protein insertion efficiency factor YidD n=1 Tax=Corynebacterium sp. TaxID=1720 RepID=UPI0026DFF828|nr:membrane protein insertion efficiency factor YidD [Corynebacterium sp.]MDO5511506.1 membrane protein insertion efficiency factor YidD [Corynebacterium sp.]
MSRLSPAARLLESAVLFYQKNISPLKMGSSCRFEPSCSAYALDAVRGHGALKGLIMALARLSKCGPWHPGGYDPA